MLLPAEVSSPRASVPSLLCDRPAPLLGTFGSSGSASETCLRRAPWTKPGGCTCEYELCALLAPCWHSGLCLAVLVTVLGVNSEMCCCSRLLPLIPLRADMILFSLC